MIRTGQFSVCLRTTAALLLVACTSQAPANPGEAAANAQPEPRLAVASLEVSDRIVDLAERGKFAELGDVVADLPQNAETRALAKSIQTYQEHLTERREAKQQAYDDAIAEAMEELEAGKVEDAMVKIIEAHSLAEHPEKLLAKEHVAALIAKVVAKAEKAHQEARFVDSLSLYRLLDLLYEESRQYHEQYLDSATHVRVLQLYNPKLLDQLYIERAERLGDEEALKLFKEAAEQEDEDWTIQLDGITPVMLGQTFSHATTRHIDKTPYVELVKGAVDNLTMMVQTEGIEDIFPGLKDQTKRDAMQAKLDAVAKDLDRPGRRLNRLTAMSIIDEVMQVNTQTIALPTSVIVYELTTGATSELDEFSSVIWPEDYRQFLRSIKGDFVGVGVQIQKIDGKLTVVTPLEGTPAMKAGLKAEDIIAKVNGVSTGGWTIDKAVRNITGEQGTKVTLTILREGVEPFNVEITRQKINIESIKGFAHRDTGGWDYWVDRDAGIGYIRMTQFLKQSAEDMDAAIQQMQREGELRGVVLDLRFNPGGLLSTAIQVVDRFIPAGRIVSTVNAQGLATSSHSASLRNTYPRDLDLVILINQGSASASEIVSGALQDYERAIVLGENSFGKGSVQDIFPIGQGDAFFKCTTQYYQLPKGQIIHRKDDSTEWGVQPDFEVKMTNKEVADWLEARRDADILIAEEDRDPDNPQTDPADILKDGVDPQLEAALLLLKAKQLSGKIELAQKGE